MRSKIRRTYSAAATLAAAGLTMTACAVLPTYEADPIGTDEQCFSIERETPDEAALGVYCAKPGASFPLAEGTVDDD